MGGGGWGGGFAGGGGVWEGWFGGGGLGGAVWGVHAPKPKRWCITSSPYHPLLSL